MHNIHKMPAIFIGHGSPENAFEDNEFSAAWQKIATLFPQPKAILVVSAHWTSNIDQPNKGTQVTTNKNPETIHDFYGFPQNYYEFSYSAPGNPILAEKIIQTIKTTSTQKNATWGFDHGAWTVLKKMYPGANIPVLQLSIDENLTTQEMFNIGKELSHLREEGVLILGSGNIVHNLRAINWHGKPYVWAQEFDEYIKNALLKKEATKILEFEKHPAAKLALPTQEHFLPLIYILGASQNENSAFFTETIFAASLSMRCVAYGI